MAHKHFATWQSTVKHPNWLKRRLRVGLIIFTSLVVVALYATMANLYFFPAFAYCDELFADESVNGTHLNITKKAVIVYFFDGDPELTLNITNTTDVDGWWLGRPLCVYSAHPLDHGSLVFRFLGILVAPLVWWAVKMYKMRPDSSHHAINCCARCNLPRKVDNLMTGAGANLLLGSATSIAFHSDPRRYEVSYPITHMILDLLLVLALLLVVPMVVCPCCRKCTKWLVLLFIPFFGCCIMFGFFERLSDQLHAFDPDEFELYNLKDFSLKLAADISLSIPKPGPLVGLISASIVGPCVFAVEAIESIFDDKIPVLGISLGGYGKKLRRRLNAEDSWEDDEENEPLNEIELPGANAGKRPGAFSPSPVKYTDHYPQAAAGGRNHGRQVSTYL